MTTFKRFLIILNVLFLILIAIFFTQNSEIVSVTFLFWQYESAQSIVLLSTFFTGAIISLLFILPFVIKGNKKTDKTADKEAE
ncbi:LapA family protein [Aliifodinibius salipaludis]